MLKYSVELKFVFIFSLQSHLFEIFNKINIISYTLLK